jgi:nucleotide-binding universal stress UspA family protein
MKKILLPTDFSDSANNALDYALHLAKKTGADITLLNVARTASGNSTMHRNIRDILKKDSEESLEKLVRKIKRDPVNKDIQIQHISRYGSLSMQIQAAVRALCIDLIVMGTHGATGMKEIVFGSNTANIIKEVTACPLLAVPYNAPLHNISKIVFATNYAGNTDIIKELSSLADTLGATIQILHIRTPQDISNETVINQFKQNLMKEAPQAKFTFHEFAHENVVEGLQKYVDAEKIDLLAMSTRKRSFLDSFIDKSLTQTAAFHTTIPLLAFHDKEKV